MKKGLVSIAMSIVVFAALFGLIAPVLQAQPVSFSIYGQVFDGTTPVNGVTVNVTNLETGSSVGPTVTANGGWYSVDLASLQPDHSHSAGDRIQIFADDGACKTNTTVVLRGTAPDADPQRVDLILQAETAPPTITSLQPPDDSFINNTKPTISANYSDDSGINESSVEMRMDGSIVIPDSLSETGVSYTPAADLGEGLHNVTVNVSDNCANQNSTSWSFTLDTIAPTIKFIEPPTPANNTEVNISYVNVSVNVTDYSSGIDNATVVMVWNETGYPMAEYMYAFTEGKYYCVVSNLKNGNYTYWVQADDIAGNMNVSETRVVTVNVTEYTVNVALESGYNMISLPINDSSVTNASTLATKIGGDCAKIVKWDSATQAYVSYIPGVPLNDFNTAGGEGYFANLNNLSSVEFTGIGWESPFTISLVTGYNIIGIPVNDTTVTNASTLATKIGGDCAKIVKWDSATQAYVSYIPGVPLNDFNTAGGEGYFVNMVNPMDVTFAGEPWRE